MKNSIIALIIGMTSLTSLAGVPQNEALRTIVSNNLELKSMDASLRGDILSSRQGTQLSGPEVEGEYLVGPKEVKNRWSAGVSQSFDWPGVYGAKRRAVSAQQDAAALQLAERLTAVALDARLTMIDGVYNTAQTRVLDILKANLDSIAADIETGYKAGQYNVLDLKKIRVEAFSLNARLEECRTTLAEIRSTLSALNGGQGIDVDMSAYSPDALSSLDQYLDDANSDFGVLASMAAGEVANREAHVAKLERLPGFSVGYQHAYEDGTHFNGVTASISIPSWGSNYGRKAAEARAEAANIESQNRLAAARANMSTLYTTAANQKSLLNAYQGIVLDEEYPELLLMAYRGGQMNVITYIQETNYYLETRLEYLSAEHQYRRALATLNALSTARALM
jgi:outer membrane protein TolC